MKKIMMKVLAMLAAAAVTLTGCGGQSAADISTVVDNSSQMVELAEADVTEDRGAIDEDDAAEETEEGRGATDEDDAAEETEEDRGATDEDDAAKEAEEDDGAADEVEAEAEVAAADNADEVKQASVPAPVETKPASAPTPVEAEPAPAEAEPAAAPVPAETVVAAAPEVAPAASQTVVGVMPDAAFYGVCECGYVTADQNEFINHLALHGFGSEDLFAGMLPATQPVTQPETPVTQPVTQPVIQPEIQPATQPTESVHTHVWKEHTAETQIWVPNKVAVGTLFNCSGCDFETTDVNAINEHSKNTILNGEIGHSHGIRTIYEDQSHYETMSYVDYYYCDCGETKPGERYDDYGNKVE